MTRRLLNLPKMKQKKLASAFSWLRGVHENEQSTVQQLSVSVFDHWLSEAEADLLLAKVSFEEQLRRDRLHAGFCARIARETGVLSFVFRGRQHDRLVFRAFTSAAPLSAYFTPHGGKTLGHSKFHVVLPELNCAFYEGWDDTHQLYFTERAAIERVCTWAEESGLHVLESR